MISTKDIKHISQLARLNLTNSEIKKFKPQLSKIIEYVNKLNEVDTKNIDPTSHVIKEIKNRFQDENVREQTVVLKNAIRNAKKSNNGYFMTKAVVTRFARSSSLREL